MMLHDWLLCGTTSILSFGPIGDSTPNCVVY